MAEEDKDKQNGGAPAAAKDEAKAPTKVASIVTGTKLVKVGGKEHRVPVAVEISKESDLKPELTQCGPTKPRFGAKNVNCYMTVDAQRLKFVKGELVDIS